MSRVKKERKSPQLPNVTQNSIINEDDEATSSKDFDFNRYATKKTFSNGFLNGALLATNGAQLKLLLTESLYAKGNRSWSIAVSLVMSSLLGQVLLLALTGVLANKSLAIKKNISFTNVINNIVMILSGLLFCVNIIINVFIQIETSGSSDQNNLTSPSTVVDELMFTSELSRI